MMVKSVLVHWTPSLNDRSKLKGQNTDVKSGSGISVGLSLKPHSPSWPHTDTAAVYLDVGWPATDTVAIYLDLGCPRTDTSAVYLDLGWPGTDTAAVYLDVGWPVTDTAAVYWM